MSKRYVLDPYPTFHFDVAFVETKLDGTRGDALPLCRGAFAECTGLEATMEPRAIKEGGRNYGAVQRAGQVTFATVILKRGVTDARHLWQWFDFVVQQGRYAYRLTATITLLGGADQPLVKWTLANALPVKFKAPDLNAMAGEVGVEELHFVHEGLNVEKP